VVLGGISHRTGAIGQDEGPPERRMESLNSEAGAHWRMDPSHTQNVLLHPTLIGHRINKKARAATPNGVGPSAKRRPSGGDVKGKVEGPKNHCRALVGPEPR
jgi:hypothetical protein